MKSMVRMARQAPIILLIDDDPTMQGSLTNYLKNEAYEIVAAQTAREGLVLYDRFLPDIVLLDDRLPDMDSFECCSELIKRENPNNVPILMMTRLDDQESILQALQYGATDYVQKPVHWAVLRHRLQLLLNNSRMVMQLELANMELSRLATQDGLTFVANRRCFDITLDREWRRMLRDQKPLSLILCDIDYFKPYNDTYGHQGGDRCLKRVANILAKAGRRPADLVARYGGEEFAILLPDTPVHNLLHITEGIQQKLQAEAIAHESSPISKFVTVSMGIAGCIPKSDVAPESLIDCADRALYLAKSRGRNRTERLDWYVTYITQPADECHPLC